MRNFQNLKNPIIRRKTRNNNAMKINTCRYLNTPYFVLIFKGYEVIGPLLTLLSEYMFGALQNCLTWQMNTIY